MRGTNDSDSGGLLILVVEDVEETRDGIEGLLNADGYRVDPARSEQEAVIKARHQRPDLILLSLGKFGTDAASIASHVLEHAGLGQDIPVVIFCDETIPQGTHIEIQRNIFLTRPDNFEQLRTFLRSLLYK